MERGCFNCKHKNDVSRIFRCAECADGRYYLWTPMTNADKIWQMSDEELARWIARETTEGGRLIPNEKYEWWLDWLKQEVVSDV